MARSRRSNAAPASDDAQTTLVTNTAKTRSRRSADDEIALYEAKLASALDRKLLERVKDHISTHSADKRLLEAFTAMTRLRPWLSAKTYDRIYNELTVTLGMDAEEDDEGDDEEEEDDEGT